ncbi:MAG TPA: tetratricopeptide repeat protein [Candidatus Angelobacter sp.]|nr:tetratricopeptide repeat protein [Candidatus Angelobacter sp.]
MLATSVRSNLACLFLLVIAIASAKALSPQQVTANNEVPITTPSAEARKLFLQGREARENWHLPEALDAWRAASHKDPKFALAFVYVSFYTPDPKEELSARTSAKRLAPSASPGEQLLIQWFTGAKEGEFISAISAMNDLLAKYPDDKWLLFQAGRWLILQRRWDKGIDLLQRALVIDPDYTAALNQVGYAYASFTWQFDKAYAVMEHYSKIKPQEPNPLDSWGEILREGGEFEKSLEQYRKALQLDPHFYSAQLGLADTYAVMGQEERARKEYEKAIQQATNQRDQVSYMNQFALTYVREAKYDLADQAYMKSAERARQLGLFDMQADAHRFMAMYQPGIDKALVHLDEAAKILHENHSIAAENAQLSLSRVLYIRTWKATKANKIDVASIAVEGLGKIANHSGSNLVRQNYHGAAGMLAIAQGKYLDAIAHLEEEDRFTHLISMEQLALAYEKNGDREPANDLKAALKRANFSNMEQALVTMPLRKTN